jgi:glutamate/tyrosine decarboxylase-like PLP-dependent enzyme
MATEIEKQTIRWISEFVGVSSTWDGILVSGGNMANFTAFLAARTAKAGKDFKAEGIHQKKLVVYCSRTTHTWIEKAMILFGHGTNALRWIETEADNRISIPVLKDTINKDLHDGYQPFMVVGTAGDVSTGVVDDLTAIASICKAYELWFHVDGAYGGPAAILPELKDLFAALEEADSIALDPHKWLYSPLEAGCTLVKNPQHLIDTYSSHPEYYNFSKNEGMPARNFFEYGLQNSRGFRALKVWLVLQQLGRTGYVKLIRKDIALSKLLFQLADQHPELEAVSQNLSITTLRYIPEDIDAIENKEVYLNKLNETLLDALQIGGKVFLSNAVVKGAYCLRGCFVNFRTSEKDIKEIIAIVVREGRAMHAKLMN